MRQIGIIGGGLAGLYCAIALKKKGLDVVLLEKGAYPFHKVCGEYLSKEVNPYFQEIGIDITKLCPSEINKLDFVTGSGESWKFPLPLGAYGISRYALDNYLYNKALQEGVEVRQQSHVKKIEQKGGAFILSINGSEELAFSRIIAGYGKRSSLDKKLGRKFIQKRSPFLGVKYHFELTGFPADTIGMYTFPGGYCGVTKVEGEKYCISYLIKSEYLKQEGSIENLEKNILSQNSSLKEIFRSGKSLFDKPLAINEISFDKKSLYENGIFFCGDSTGMITPLCGNGMAMAITGASFLSEEVISLVNGEKTDDEAIDCYKKKWKDHFSSRLFYGKMLQEVVFNSVLSSAAIKLVSFVPAAGRYLIRKTHGKTI